MTEIILLSIIDWWWGVIAAICLGLMLAIRWGLVGKTNINRATKKFESRKRFAYIALGFLTTIIIIFNSLGFIELGFLVLFILGYSAYKHNPDTFMRNMSSILKYSFNFIFESVSNLLRGFFEVIVVVSKSFMKSLRIR